MLVLNRESMIEVVYCISQRLQEMILMLAGEERNMFEVRNMIGMLTT